MKIAYITSKYPAVSHTFIQREILALQAAGHDILPVSIRAADPATLLSEDDKAEAARTAVILPPTFGRLLGAVRVLLTRPLGALRGLWTAVRDRPPGLRAAIWSLFYFVEALILADQLSRRGIRHVHAHFANVASAVAQAAAEIVGGSWSVTIHGLSDFGDPSSNALPARLRSARFVICVSRFGQAQAMLHLPREMWSKLHVVYCGIDPQRFQLRKQRPENAAPRILSVARLSREKGHRVLLDALVGLRDRGVAFVCTMVGDGPLRDELQQAARERDLDDVVDWVGAIGQDRIQAFYEQADVFVLPSLAEGLPVVLMEALAKGVPCVASGMMGIPELIEHNRGGLLVPPGDVDALRDALQAMLEDPQLRADTATVGRERVLQTFDLGRNVAQLADLFAEQLGDRA